MGREKKPEHGAGLPQRAFVYAPPQATPRETEHRTLELKRVRLAPEIDPRHQRTQMLRRGPGPVAAGSVSRRQIAWLAAFGGLVGAGTWVVTGLWFAAPGGHNSADVAGETPVAGGPGARDNPGFGNPSGIGNPAIGNPAVGNPGRAVAPDGETRLLPLHHAPAAESPGSVGVSAAVLPSAPAAPNRAELGAAAAGAAGRAAPRTASQPRDARTAASGAAPAEAPPRAWVLPREPEVWLK